MTCYLLFYPTHPYLNRMIATMSQKELLKAASIMAGLYIIFAFIVGEIFFANMIILWLTGYLIVAYIKLYCKDAYANPKVNAGFLTVGIICAVGIVLIMNLAGLKIPAISGQLLRSASNYNPFLIMIAISGFGLARNNHFKSGAVNQISKCSMLIYIIHENILLRTYLRPYIWHYIYNQYGYSHIILRVLIFAMLWFAMALGLALLYEKSIQKITKKISEKLLKLTGMVYQKYEEVMLRIH